MPAGTTQSRSTGHALRVLLVEDNQRDQGLVRRALREPAPLPAPVEVEVVADVDAALAAVRRATFAVILTDYSLPGRNGLEFLRDLREADDRTPVIILTGAGDETLAVAALQQGAADYVVKELGFERALPVVIDRVLGKRAAELEIEQDRARLDHYAKRLERQVDDQKVSLRRALQESEALRQIGRTLAAARELIPALNVVAQTAAELVRARAAAVVIRSGTNFVLASVWGALKQPAGLQSADVVSVLSAGWAETAIAPLREVETEIGLLWAGRLQLQPFSPHELELLEAVADITALSIANVRAHEHVRHHADPGPPRVAEETIRPEPRAPTAAPSPIVGSAPVPVDPSGLRVPPFPAALGRLLALTEQEDVTPAAIQDAVGLDPTLAARAIQLASAPALGRARPVSSLGEALVVLGVRGVRNLAFAQFARRLVLRWGLVDQLLWEQSIGAAAGTQLLLEARDPTVATDAYLCGLLHNVGAVALNSAYPERYERSVQRSIREDCPIDQAEREEFGCDAATITEQLVLTWSVPVGVTRVLTTSRRDVAGTSHVVLALRWARMAALRTSPAWRRLLGRGPEPDWIAHELEAVEKRLDLPDAALEELRRSTAARCQVLRGMVA